MIPTTCTWWRVPFQVWSIFKNDVYAGGIYDWDYKHDPVLIKESDYEAGDTFQFRVHYYWYGYTAEDFTVKVYSKQALEVKDQRGHTNELHMDGTQPSGFTGLFPYQATE